MKKFTLPAGTTNRHKWHKEAAAAVSDVTRTFDMMRQKYGTIGGDESENLVTVFSFGVDDPKNPEAVEIYNGLGARFDWAITRDNAAEVAEAFREALPACMETVPIEDNRRTPDQDAENAKLRHDQDAERKAKAAEKSARVEELAAELRKQYPNAIGPDSGKSGHARASANLKRILQDMGLRARVTSSSFSMGNSVTARVLTPDLTPEQRKEIDRICQLFNYGTFDAMTDSSGYDRSDDGEAWEIVNGRAKYCRAEYEQSDENKCAIREFLGDDIDDEYGNDAKYRVWTGAHCLASDFWTKWTEDHKQPEPEPVASGSGFTVEKHHHTKKGFDFWLVVLADRVERDEFTRLRDSCKAAGGWYSRKWKATPGGFAFTEREAAGAWALQKFGEGPPDPTPPPARRGTSKRGKARAVKFRTLAENLQSQIEAKLGDRLTNTPKRQREAMSARIDGDRLQRTQDALLALADMHEAGEVPELLAGFTSKSAIHKALGTRTESQGYYHIGDTHEPTDTSPEATALWSLVNGKTDEQRAADELRDKIEALQFSKIPGYFPTPPAIIERMLELADIGMSHVVCEPSAGAGAVLDAIAEQFGGDPASDACPTIVAYEINPTLAGILQAKGYATPPSDFLESGGQFQYDRVLMNPPFEKLQDIDHVCHAFNKLKAGGRLVAIMSPGPFFREDQKCRTFRGWFENLGGTVEDIEAGAFKESGTGVASKLVVIDKPALSPEPAFTKPDEDAPAGRVQAVNMEPTEQLALI